MNPITVSPFSVENITAMNCVNPKGKLLWSSLIGRESLVAYRLRMNMLIKAEIPGYLASGGHWKDFDPGKDNLIFPPTINNFCLQYAGYGEMLSYNLGTLRSTLFALKGNNTEKQCFKAIDQIDFSASNEIEEIGHIIVNYSNGKSVDIDPKARYARWTDKGSLLCSYVMKPTETASELLAAIERYAEGGDLDPRYALFLVKPLGVHLRELDNSQKGRFLDDDLGL